MIKLLIISTNDIVFNQKHTQRNKYLNLAQKAICDLLKKVLQLNASSEEQKNHLNEIPIIIDLILP